MANGRDGTKSQAIQEYMAANPGASPLLAVQALRQKGIEVSLGLAKVVKYGKYDKQGRKNASVKKTKRIVWMTENAQPAVSGSESIRQYIARNPAAGPKAIEAGLKAEGIRVSTHLINAVKYSKAKKVGKKRRVSRTPVVQAVARATSSLAPTFDQLLQVKTLAGSLGGADQVRAALEALAQLR